MPLWLLNPAMLKAAKVAAVWIAKHPEIVVIAGQAAGKLWSYMWPSQTDDPPSDAPREADVDVQRQGAAPPLDAPPKRIGFCFPPLAGDVRQGPRQGPRRDSDGGPDAFLKEDRRKPPGPLSAPPH